VILNEIIAYYKKIYPKVEIVIEKEKIFGVEKSKMARINVRQFTA
jgi:hypothetical protein